MILFSFKREKFFSSVSKKVFSQKKSWLNNILNQKMKKTVFARNRFYPPKDTEAVLHTG